MNKIYKFIYYYFFHYYYYYKNILKNTILSWYLSHLQNKNDNTELK